MMRTMTFRKYKKTDSGVTAYKIERDNIKVVFGDMVYTYSYQSAGKEHVENMKQLARHGAGLSTYISKNVKEHYENKYEL